MGLKHFSVLKQALTIALQGFKFALHVLFPCVGLRYF
jgi:hypothetical protein